jgi:alpha-D-ribose 1-methylphosphonate 5-triphosphate diphosphatase
MSEAVRIQGGSVLAGGAFVETTLTIEDGRIAALGANTHKGRTLDAQGLYVLPGIVDIHGDAFERQLMPRPGVHFPAAMGLKDSDRQAIANGITTVFHGVTASWEPGLRSIDNARAIVTAVEDLKDNLAADTRLHLRYEAFNLGAEAEVADWLAARRIDMLGFNDHMIWENTPPRVRKLSQMAERAGLSPEDFTALVERLRGRAEEVPAATERLAAAARAGGVPTLSHDDMSPEQRRWFRARDCRVAEFPTTIETAEEATAAGDDIVLGAPNVVRGGSHVGWINAADMIARGFCTVLASDYYYPAPLLAAFRLAADGIAPLTQAWTYVAASAARAARLNDRGTLTPGLRADLIVVDGSSLATPNVVATLVQGRIVHLTEPDRLH